jgi:hypothetical protein
LQPALATRQPQRTKLDSRWQPCRPAAVDACPAASVGKTKQTQGGGRVRPGTDQPRIRSGRQCHEDSSRGSLAGRLCTTAGYVSYTGCNGLCDRGKCSGQRETSLPLRVCRWGVTWQATLKIARADSDQARPAVRLVLALAVVCVRRGGNWQGRLEGRRVRAAAALSSPAVPPTSTCFRGHSRCSEEMHKHHNHDCA